VTFHYDRETGQMVGEFDIRMSSLQAAEMLVNDWLDDTAAAHFPDEKGELIRRLAALLAAQRMALTPPAVIENRPSKIQPEATA
jgi:hypothetical protein